MIYSRRDLPLIELNKIKISKNSKYSLDADVSLVKASPVSESEYQKTLSQMNNIKIVLVVLTTHTENYLPRFQRERSRHRALMDFKTEERGYVHEISIGGFSDRATFRTKPVVGSNSMKIIIAESALSFELPEISDLKESKIENVHLLAFLQLQATTTEPPVYNYTPNASLEYELLLSRAGSQGLVPPSKRKVFYAPSSSDPKKMVPYAGPAHYHSPQNPGPDGYIGWMVSHARGRMGKKLKIREVENYKIILEKSLDPINKEEKKVEIPKTFPPHTTGTGLRKHALGQIDISLKSDPAFVTQKLIESSQSSLEKDKKSFFYGLGNETAHISTKEANPSNNYSSSKYENYQGLVFGVDVASMLRYRSQHGALLDFHYKKGNMNIIIESLKRSSIQKLSVNRSRISDRAHMKSQRGTFEHTKKEKEKLKSIVISSDKTTRSPSYRGNLKRFRSLNGEIQEINLVGLTSQGEVFNHPDCKYMRQFLFKDFDLFHNVTEGVYTYAVEFEMVDGMQKYLETIYDRLQKTIIQYEKYLKEIEFLTLSNSKSQKNASPGLPAENVKAATESNTSLVSSAVSVYYLALNIVDGNDASKDQRDNILNAISPINVDLKSVSKFLASLKSLATKYSDLLNIKGGTPSGKRSSSNLQGAIPGVIKESFKTMSKVKAFNPSKVIASHLDNLGNMPSIPVSSLRSRLASKKVNNTAATSYVPEKLLTIQGQEYETIDEFKTGKEKKVSDINFNEIVKIKEISNADSFKAQNLKLKLSVLESKGADKKGAVDKNDLFFFGESQKLGAGIKLKIREKTNNKKSKKESEKNTNPDLSLKLQKSIYEVSKEVDNKDMVIKKLEKEYKTASNIRSKLGTMFDSVASSVEISEKILSSTSEKKLYQNKYEGTSGAIPSESKGKIPFEEQYSAKLKSILPGVYNEEVSVEKIKLNEIPRDNQSGRRYILMKLENIFSKDILQSNNLFLVEV